MKQERGDSHNNLHYPGESLRSHVQDLRNQEGFNDGNISFLEARSRIRELIGLLKEAPDSRHVLRIAKKIESGAISLNTG